MLGTDVDLKTLALVLCILTVPGVHDCNQNHGSRNVTFLNDSCPINPPNATSFDFAIFLDALDSGVPESKNFPLNLFYCFRRGL